LIADDYQKYIVPGLTHWQHPSFFGYFPTACTFEGILGELYSSSTANPGFNVPLLFRSMIVSAHMFVLVVCKPGMY
jgi:hypothetical protein